ncbi:MAG: hypothetical protein PHO18_03515 [Synergistaceae bacterium]|nr:hypothetical protein [Synergistaceae bacterium]
MSMIFFVRSGPETIVFTFTGNFEKAEQILLSWGEYAGSDIEEAFSISGEFCRIVAARIKNEDGGKEQIRVYISETSIQRLLCMMLNARLGEGIAESRMQPGYILMRLLGNVEKGIQRIKEDFGGKLISNVPYFSDPLPEDSSVIYFTDAPLNHQIPHSHMHSKALYIAEHSKEKLIAALRMRQNEYLGDSMGTPDWNSMEIQIGDKEGRFSLHRKRIWTAVEGLQIGTILEEGWKKEYTLMGKMVDVYLLKLFTPLDEEAIKGFLSGLEYDDTGERVADLDLFFKGRKISWKERGKEGGLSKTELGIAARKRMLRKLDKYSLSKMHKLDDELKSPKI